MKIREYTNLTALVDYRPETFSSGRRLAGSTELQTALTPQHPPPSSQFRSH